MVNGAAALGAELNPSEPVGLFSLAYQLVYNFFAIAVAVVLLLDFYHLLDDLCYGVGAGGNLHPGLANGGGAPYALELLYDGLDVHPRAQRDGDKPCSGFGLRGAAACLAGVGEHLDYSLVVEVDRDVEVAAAYLDLFGKAAHDFGAGAGLELKLRLFAGYLSDIENLRLPAAVPVNGDALAAELVSELVHLVHVLNCCSVFEIYGL